jgi:hypothetical protein
MFVHRLVFFVKINGNDNQNKYFYEDKLKESRRQLEPLANVLDLPENQTGDKLVGEAMLDFRDVQEEVPDTHSKSSSEESRFSGDCSMSDDL